MFSLIKQLGFQDALRRESIPLVTAFVIADVFYKWHSFALECLGFLATWYVLSFLQSLIVARSSR